MNEALNFSNKTIFVIQQISKSIRSFCHLSGNGALGGRPFRPTLITSLLK